VSAARLPDETNEVYIRATRAAILSAWEDEARPSHILTYAGGASIEMETKKTGGLKVQQEDADDDIQLPSWVTDWNQHFADNINKASGPELCYANHFLSPTKAGMTPDQFFLNDDILNVFGLRFDTVFDVGLTIYEIKDLNIADFIWHAINLFKLRSGHSVYKPIQDMEAMLEASAPMPDSHLWQGPEHAIESMATMLVMDWAVGREENPQHYGVLYDPASMKAGKLEILMY
jgi:hypothetical protein